MLLRRFPMRMHFFIISTSITVALQEALSKMSNEFPDVCFSQRVQTVDEQVALGTQQQMHQNSFATYAYPSTVYNFQSQQYAESQGAFLHLPWPEHYCMPVFQPQPPTHVCPHQPDVFSWMEEAAKDYLSRLKRDYQDFSSDGRYGHICSLLHRAIQRVEADMPMLTSHYPQGNQLSGLQETMVPLPEAAQVLPQVAMLPGLACRYIEGVHNETDAFETDSSRAGPVVLLSDKVYAPVDKYPRYNFGGRLMGPGGLQVKKLEQDIGCKILLRGRGSLRKPEKVKSVLSKKEMNEPLHVLIQVVDFEKRAQMKLARAKSVVERIMIPGVNDALQNEQLAGLALMRGTYRATGRLMPEVFFDNAPMETAPSQLPPHQCNPCAGLPMWQQVSVQQPTFSSQLHYLVPVQCAHADCPNIWNAYNGNVYH